MLTEQFKAVIYTTDKEYIEEMQEEIMGLSEYSIGPFPTYEMAKACIAREAQTVQTFDHGVIEKVFVWQEV